MSTQGERLRTFPVFKGMFRPPLIFGITLGSFLLIAMASVYVFLFTRSFVLPLLVFAPAFAACYALCQRDPQIFRLFDAWNAVKQRTFELPSRRDALWEAKSYAPHAIRLPRSVRRRLRHGRRMRPKSSLDAWIPAAVQVNPYTIQNKDGSKCQFLAIEGLHVETRASSDLNHRVGVLSSMLRSLGPQFAVYHHMVRREVRPTLPGACAPGSFAAEVHERWQKELDRHALFENAHYLTVVRRSSDEGRARRRFARRAPDQAARAGREAAELRELEEAVATILQTLKPYRVRRLSIVTDASGEYSEPLALLSELIQCDRRRVRVPSVPLDQILGCKRITFGRETLEIRGAAPEDVRFGAILTIQEPSRRTYAGMLDVLQRVPYELRTGQSACVVGRSKALRALKLQQRQMNSVQDDAVTLQQELSAATDAVASGAVGFVDHHWSVLVLGRSAQELAEALSAVTSALECLELTVVRSDLTLEADYWSQIPGNWKTRARRALVSTENLACWMSLHGEPRGTSEAHWGAPVTLLETTSSTPYAFDFHAGGGAGHFTLLGQTGSGKTSVSSFLFAETQSLPQPPRFFILDFLQGSEVFVRAMGGPYLRFRPGEPTRVNPFQLPDTPRNRAFQEALLGLMLAPTNGQLLSAQERAIIGDAVASLHESRSGRRRLQDLEELLRGEQLTREVGESLADRFKRWLSGDLAWVFGAEEPEGLWDGPYLGIDLTQILGDPLVRQVLVAYLAHRIDEWFDGYPTIVLAEEAWRYVDDPLMVTCLREWFRAGRRRNGVIGFCSQSAQDARESRLASSIIEQAKTQIWLPNPQALEEVCCGVWKLTPEEFERVQSTPIESRCFLLKQGQESTMVRLDLSGMRDLLPVLAGNLATVRQVEALRAQVGEDPAAWLPLLRAGGAKEGTSDA